MARKTKAAAPLDDDGLSTVVKYYETSAESTNDARDAAERDRDYYDNRHWTLEEETALKKRGQPIIIRNRIKPKIDSMLGLERQGRTNPRANPRTPMDSEAANACTDSIRFVCDESDFNSKRSEVFENLLIEGSGGAIVEVDDKQNVKIRYIPWDRSFADPHSRARNFADAKYKGIVVWLDEDEAVAIYGEDAKPVLEQSWSAYDQNRTYDDKPAHERWVDGKRKRVKVVEIYYRENGIWRYCVFTKAGYLLNPQDSAYLDEDSEPECPIEYMSCHVDRDNNRYGEVRQLIGPQDEINKRASKALHRMTMQQTIAERGAVEDIQKWKREQAKPDGFLEHNPGLKAEIQQNTALTQFEFQMLAEAKQEIEAIGANEAMQGKGPAESGKALNIRRQSGLAETAGPFDSLHQWQRAIYIQVWHRIKQFWTAEKWVRVTDDERNIRFVGLNAPGPNGEKKNDVSRMDVDIELDDVPDVASAQQEEFTAMAEAYKANPQSPVNPGGIPFDLVIETSNLRSKQKILDRLRGVQPGQQGQMGPNGQLMQQDQQPGGMPGMTGQTPDPAQMLGQAAMQSGQQLQSLAEQIMQAIQKSAQEVGQMIEQAGQQTAQQVQQAGLEAVNAIQQATGQAMTQVATTAAANGAHAMLNGMQGPPLVVAPPMPIVQPPDIVNGY